ncbi:hypothetical protein EYC84_011389 [Monilinia fructicola]|uniref:BTB domain-containing protein n=1 Tax=Monilinia fructicola TaxID=38448 RepID=A0A5M9J9Y4_MONFR|nr:hypothetical protein EYC84_011389 [Monilinia fructicola]
MFGRRALKNPFPDRLDHRVVSPEKQDFPVFISNLYLTGKYSDLIIKSQEKELKEAATGVINLEDDEPEIVEYMIKFLYHGTYLIAPKKDEPKTATLGEDETAPTPEEAPAGESLLSSLSTSLPSSDSSVDYAFLNGYPRTTKIVTRLQPPTPMTGRPLFETLPTPFASATTDDRSSAFVPTIGTAFVSDMFRQIPTPTSTFSSLPRPSNAVSGSGASMASMVNLSGDRRTSGVVPLSRNRQGEEPLAASAPSASNSNDTFPNPRTSWIFTEAGRQWLEAEKSVPIFKSRVKSKATTKTQAANIEKSAEDLIKHAKVYIIADKYDIQSLKDHARRMYSANLFSCWNTSYFVQSIELVFDGTPDISEGDSLRNTVIEAASIHAGQLLRRGDFFQLCEERGDITTAILQARVDLL